MSTATIDKNNSTEVEIDQRLQGVRTGAIRVLLTLAAFPKNEVSATELTTAMDQHRSTTTSQLGELTNLGVVLRTTDPATGNRTNPTYLYTVNPEVDLVEVAELFFDILPESQALLAKIQAKSVLERVEPSHPEVAIEFDSQLAQLVTALTRKVVELNERVVELELQPSRSRHVLPPDLTEALRLLAQ